MLIGFKSGLVSWFNTVYSQSQDKSRLPRYIQLQCKYKLGIGHLQCECKSVLTCSSYYSQHTACMIVSYIHWKPHPLFDMVIPIVVQRVVHVICMDSNLHSNPFRWVNLINYKYLQKLPCKQYIWCVPFHMTIPQEYGVRCCLYPWLISLWWDHKSMVRPSSERDA